MAIETTQMIVDANTVAAIIANINSIYTNLVNYTVGIIIVVGAALPAAISFFQNKKFSRDHDAFSKQINVEISKSIIEMELKLEDIIKEKLRTEIASMKNDVLNMQLDLERKIARANGSAFHLQANQSTSSFAIIESSFDALTCYLEGEDGRNVRSILLVIEAALKKSSKKDFDSHDSLEEIILDIVKTLQDHDEKGTYSLDIETIKSSMKFAKIKEA